VAILADTSGLYAVLDRDDRNHGAAADAWKRLIKSRLEVAVHDFVLVESWSLIQARLGMSAVETFHREFLPFMTLHRVTAEVLSRGMARCLGARRRDLSLADCVSFELAASEGISRAFAFDRDFKEAGLLLSDDPSWPG
jgi:predicted nucleic acid-binding protein